MKFPDKLKEKRISNGLTQEELAKKIFVSRTLITKYESGDAIPTKENIEKLALALNVKITDLMGTEDSTLLTLENEVAIKDFDLEYNVTDEKKTDIKFKIFNLPIVFSLLIIFVFCLCHQVFSIDKFPWSVTIILIPNIALLLIKFLIVIVKRYSTFKNELFSMLFSLMLYLPFIFIFIMGERDNLVNYLITFQFDVVIFGIVFLIHRKKISLHSILLLCISILTFFGFFIMNNQNYMIELIIKYLILILIGIGCTIDLFRNNINWKITLISIGLAIFINIIYFLCKFNFQIYDFYSIISIFFVIILCLQFSLKKKNNFTLNLFNFTSVTLIVFSLALLVNSVLGVIKTGLHSNINSSFLINITMFLFLILFQKYVCNKKCANEKTKGA